MRGSESSRTKILPSEPTLFRMRRAVISSMCTVLLVRVMSAIVPGSSRRSWKLRAAGIPDAAGGALLLEQATSNVSIRRQQRSLGFIIALLREYVACRFFALLFRLVRNLECPDRIEHQAIALSARHVAAGEFLFLRNWTQDDAILAGH